MNVPADFHLYCGPRAVAALLGRSTHSAAAGLWHAQTLRGRITAPGSTSPDMVLVMAADGCRISEHGTARSVPLVELLAHDELLAELVEAFHRDAATPPREHEPDPAPLPAHLERRCATEAARVKAVDLLTLAELVALAPTGRWLLTAGASPVLGQLDHHALALIDGQVVAGDTPDLASYGQAAITAAYRIEPPTREEPRP